MLTIRLPHNFSAREYQKEPMAFFDRGGKRAITVWHRRAGKDLTALHQTSKAAHRRTGTYWHFFPTLTQGRRSIWEGRQADGSRILANVFPGFDQDKPWRSARSVVERINEAEMRVELKCGSVWRLMGSDLMENVGAGPAGVIFSEYALCRPGVWDLVRPMLRENGGWMWAITTPRGRNQAWEMYAKATAESGWFRDLKTVFDTGLTFSSNRSDRQLSPSELIEEERAEGMLEALIQQEYLCDWSAALVGSVWGDLVSLLEKKGLLESWECDPDARYFTSWDLGKTDSTAIWVWRPTEDGADVVDYHEAHGKELAYYFGWLESRPWKYARHWLPHDARAQTLAAQTSIEDQCIERWGAGKVGIVPNLDLLDGIQAGRWMLQRKVRFHPRCKVGLEALRSYHYEYDDERKVFGKKPVHDWSSHGADAWRTGCVVMKHEGLMEGARARKTEKQLRHGQPVGVKSMSNLGTLEELWDTAYSGSEEGRI